MNKFNKKKEKPNVYSKWIEIPDTETIIEAKSTLLEQGYEYLKTEWEIDKILSSAVLHIWFFSIHENKEVKYSNNYWIEDISNTDKRERFERICFESLVQPQVRIDGIQSQMEHEEYLDDLRRRN